MLAFDMHTIFSIELWYAKIDQIYDWTFHTVEVTRPEEDVLWFNVLVYDAHAVQVFQSLKL